MHLAGDGLSFRATGDSARDLVDVLGAQTRPLADPAQHRAFTQFIGADQSDPDLAAAFDSHYFGPRREEALEMLDTAVSREQLITTGRHAETWDPVRTCRTAQLRFLQRRSGRPGQKAQP